MGGDFNIHHPLWGSTYIKNSEEFINNIKFAKMKIKNTETITHFDKTHNKYSSIDLTVTTNTVLCKEWRVNQCKYNPQTTMHFRIIGHITLRVFSEN